MRLPPFARLRGDYSPFYLWIYMGLLTLLNALIPDGFMIMPQARLCASGGIGKQVIEALNELARD